MISLILFYVTKTTLKTNLPPRKLKSYAPAFTTTSIFAHSIPSYIDVQHNFVIVFVFVIYFAYLFYNWSWFGSVNPSALNLLNSKRKLQINAFQWPHRTEHYSTDEPYNHKVIIKTAFVLMYMWVCVSVGI